MKIELKRSELLQELKESISLKPVDFVNKCIDVVRNKYDFPIESAKNIFTIREKFRNFQITLRTKYNKHSRFIDRVFQYESEWLDMYILNEDVTEPMFLVASSNETPVNRTNAGKYIFMLFVRTINCYFIIK